MTLYSNQEWQSGPRLAFLVIVPIAIALWYALVRTGVFAQYFPLPLALAYWLCLLVPRWWLQDLATRLLHRMLMRWRPPRVVLLTLGGALGIVFFQPYALWLIAWFQQTFAAYIPQAAQYEIVPGWAVLTGGLVGTVPQHLVALALWIVANLVHDLATGSARFGYAVTDPPAVHPNASADATSAFGATDAADATVAGPTPAAVPDSVARKALAEPVDASRVASPPAGEPPFSSRLRRVAPRQIIAVEAEDHYVRVHSSTSSELIHYRFSDAVEELRQVPGMRVHRSWWVARQAIQSIRRTGPNLSVVLVNGTQIPIGRSYSEVVKQVGLVSHS